MADRLALISHDDGLIRLVGRAAADLELQFYSCGTLDEAIAEQEQAGFAVVVCDGADFDFVRERLGGAAVLVHSDVADSDEAIRAIKHGAIHCFTRLVELSTLKQMIGEAVRVSRDLRVPAVFDSGEPPRDVDRIVGQSPAMSEVYKLIGLIAPRDINVLITGESGTGKELVARAILHHSLRSERPFLAVNCAAIPETLLESELFGHEKGAFTGADTRRIGKFEQCDGGTLFLDEIGDIPMPTQVKLLRVLQDHSFQRLGGSETVRCDVRIVAATHQPLESLIEARRFRQDLYYRIKVANIHLPSLREREVDVVILAHHFVERYNREFGTNIRSFAPETLPILLAYPWPGNVRELQNAIKAALVIARGSVFQPEFLPEEIRESVGQSPARWAVSAEGKSVKGDVSVASVIRQVFEETGEGGLRRDVLAIVERELIRFALQQKAGRLAPAARLLGMSRTTLRQRIGEYDIQIAAAIL